MLIYSSNLVGCHFRRHFKYIYKRLNDFTPTYIQQLLTRNSAINARTTRYGNTNLVCPPYKRETEGVGSFIVSSIKLWNSLPNSVHGTNETEGGRSFTVSSIKLWNSLINSVKMSDTFNSFNKALRSYFLAQHDHINNFEILIYNTWSILCIIIFILLYLHMSYFLMISLVRYAFYSKFYSVDPWNNVSEM